MEKSEIWNMKWWLVPLNITNLCEVNIKSETIIRWYTANTRCIDVIQGIGIFLQGVDYKFPSKYEAAPPFCQILKRALSFIQICSRKKICSNFVVRKDRKQSVLLSKKIHFWMGKNIYLLKEGLGCSFFSLWKMFLLPWCVIFNKQTTANSNYLLTYHE